MRGVLVAVVLLLGIAAKPHVGLSLSAKDWTVTIGRGVPLHPTQAGSGWFIDLPQLSGPIEQCNVTLSCPSLNYLTTAGSSLAGKSLLVLHMIVTFSGAPTIYSNTEPWNTCEGEPSLRLLLQKQGDWSTDYGRWWSNPLHAPLVEGASVLTVPLSPDQWTSVFGTRADASWAALSAWQALATRPGQIGMTFGGGCFFGHGLVTSGGTVRVTVTGFSAV